MRRLYRNIRACEKEQANGKDPVIWVHFIYTVHEQLSLENRHWTEDAAKINTAFL